MDEHRQHERGRARREDHAEHRRRRERDRCIAIDVRPQHDAEHGEQHERSTAIDLERTRTADEHAAQRRRQVQRAAEREARPAAEAIARAERDELVRGHDRHRDDEQRDRERRSDRECQRDEVGTRVMRADVLDEAQPRVRRDQQSRIDDAGRRAATASICLPRKNSANLRRSLTRRLMNWTTRRQILGALVAGCTYSTSRPE